MRHSFIESLARTFWVCAYADWWDNEGDDSDPHASNGEDWMNETPDTPDEARHLAHEFCEILAKKNNISIDMLLYKILNQSYAIPDDYENSFADDFGHYVAMEALGHGVSWEDDHPPHKLKLPYVSVYACSISDMGYDIERSYKSSNRKQMIDKINQYRADIFQSKLDDTAWNDQDLELECKRLGL